MKPTLQGSFARQVAVGMARGQLQAQSSAPPSGMALAQANHLLTQLVMPHGLVLSAGMIHGLRRLLPLQTKPPEQVAHGASR
jgi:hypothetical protein